MDTPCRLGLLPADGLLSCPLGGKALPACVSLWWVYWVEASPGLALGVSRLEDDSLVCHGGSASTSRDSGGFDWVCGWLAVVGFSGDLVMAEWTDWAGWWFGEGLLLWV